MAAILHLVQLLCPTTVVPTCILRYSSIYAVLQQNVIFSCCNMDENTSQRLPLEVANNVLLEPVSLR